MNSKSQTVIQQFIRIEEQLTRFTKVPEATSPELIFGFGYIRQPHLWISSKIRYCSLRMHIPSGPIETSLTPLSSMNRNDLLTLAIRWNRILPRSGLGSCSPAMTSNSNISFSPSRKSSAMSPIWELTFVRWELHQAVNAYKQSCLSIIIQRRTSGDMQVLKKKLGINKKN